VSILSEIPGSDLVEHVAIDCMHLGCLGVVKKIVNMFTVLPDGGGGRRG